MKIKSGFVLQEVAGQTVVMPVGEGLDLNMMITLNETGAFLWRQLEEETDETTLVAALLAEYDVDEQTARTHVKAYVEKLYQHGFFE
ncbi:MAG: PqqD family protein [Clostridia bacterium]|nr:PqqD family protein [Clostridia bacterium]